MGNAKFLQVYGVVLILLLFVPCTPYCFGKKHQEGQLAMEIVYILSRLVTAFVFYRMVGLLEEERDQSDANLEEIENYPITNLCVDRYTRVNVS